MKQKWRYTSVNIGGDFHDAASYITERHPDWDVVAMAPSTYYTIVVYRLPMEEEGE